MPIDRDEPEAAGWGRSREIAWSSPIMSDPSTTTRMIEHRLFPVTAGRVADSEDRREHDRRRG